MMKIFLLSFAFLTLTVFAQDETYPKVGVIASNTEIASINYSCMRPKDDKSNYRTIECEISYQTIKKGEYRNQRELIEEEFKKSGIPTDMCVMYGKKNIANMTVAEVQAELNKIDNTKNSFAKEMLYELAPILQKMCKEKTLESLIKFVEFVSMKEANTCEIETSKTKEIFRELPQNKGERSLWISEQSSIPPCGRKDIIKFIPTEKNWWHLQYEHVVLNKQAKDDNGKLCKDLDGVRNIFNSTANTWNFPCKHIKLSNRGAWNGPFNPK
ncbi:hypothetical protein B9Z46_10770 [Limnohabitans sp. Hippo4]|nr:hypothetical protein B9Z46_10770 [Limnohabitans sp. Hippo4]